MNDSKTKSKAVILAIIALFAIAALVCAAFLSAKASGDPQAQKINISAPDELPVVSLEGFEQADESANQNMALNEQAGQSQGSQQANQENQGQSKPSDNAASGSGNVEEHTHSWAYHEAVYRDDPVYESRVVCYCGAVFGSVDEWTGHKVSLGESGYDGHSYSVRKVQVDIARVMVSPEYWSCSCGATK